MSKMLNSLKVFLVGSTFMIIFGIIDNLGLFFGMDFIENYVISKGYTSLIAAGIGNAFSDAIGALIGGSIATFLYKLLKIKDKVSTAQQFVGVIIGCMIPVIVAILII